MNIKDLPKVELHLHLDGSVDIDIAKKFTNKTKNELINEMIANDKCNNLNDYLTKFSLPVSIMQTKEQLYEISKNLIKQLKEDNVIYAEVRFAPNKHIEKLTLNEVIDSVLLGLKNNDVKTNLILCMMRDSNVEDNLKIIDLAKEYQDRGVVAIDLAGAESIYKTKDFKILFDYAKRLNIPFTIHAGEADGIESINSAIEFGAQRIGHGIRAIEDSSTIKTINQKNIILEICPTSNIQTNVVSTYKEHPIKILKENNILISINTDNRTVSNITLCEEYKKLKNTFNFSIDDFIEMNINAIKYSFMSEIEKKELIHEYINKLKK